VPAIPVALKTMKKGEKASLIIKSGCKISSYSWHTHGKREMRSSY